MNIIRHICPEGLPTVADLTVSDEGEILGMTAYLVSAPDGVLTVTRTLPAFEGDSFIIYKEQELINKNPEDYNLPDINKQET